MPVITIRPAGTLDLEFLVEGNARMAFETEKLSLDRERLRAGVSAVLDDAIRGVYWIAEMDGAAAGQMMITYEWSDWRNATFWWIQSVYTLPEQRGRGVFSALYRHVESLSRQQNACGLRLYVETHNTRAQETYARCGLKQAAYQMFEVDYVLGNPIAPSATSALS
jgi:GNAT superfamily N-acetyltransferase